MVTTRMFFPLFIMKSLHLVFSARFQSVRVMVLVSCSAFLGSRQGVEFQLKHVRSISLFRLLQGTRAREEAVQFCSQGTSWNLCLPTFQHTRVWCFGGISYTHIATLHVPKSGRASRSQGRLDQVDRGGDQEGSQERSDSSNTRNR